MNFWAVLQKPPPSVHWWGRQQPESASPPERLLTILHLPLSREEIKTLFIQFIWQPELITVPGRVENYLLSKPSKPASCNAKPGTVPLHSPGATHSTAPPLPWSVQKWRIFLSQRQASKNATCIIKHILDTSLSLWRWRIKFKLTYINNF